MKKKEHLHQTNKHIKNSNLRENKNVNQNEVFVRTMLANVLDVGHTIAVSCSVRASKALAGGTDAIILLELPVNQSVSPT